MNIPRRDMPIRAFSRALNGATHRVKRVVRSHLKTHQLALIVSLDDERRLAAAAAAVGLTQPAASKLLRQIEADLGVQLFERHARGVAPTGYGEILVRRARLVLSELGLAHREIAALKAGLSGKAAIGTILEPGTNLVPAAVARMKQRCPGARVYVEVYPSRHLVQRLLQGHLDMVVGRVLDAAGADQLAYEPLAADEPQDVIASSEHPLAGRSGLRIADLIEQPWILPPAGSLVRDKLAAMFVRLDLPQPSNFVETLELPVITNLLQRSNMVVALPEAAVRAGCQAGALAVLMRSLPIAVGGFGLITRRDYQLSPVGQLMLSVLREVAAETYADRNVQ